MFSGNIPSLDLHGETKDVARILVKDFITDNYRMKNKKVLIVHGIGQGILKKEVHNELKRNRLVSKFYLDNFNVGCTVVEINDSIDKNNKKCYNTPQVRGGY